MNMFFVCRQKVLDAGQLCFEMYHTLTEITLYQYDDRCEPHCSGRTTRGVWKKPVKKICTALEKFKDKFGDPSNDGEDEVEFRFIQEAAGGSDDDEEDGNGLSHQRRMMMRII